MNYLKHQIAFLTNLCAFIKKVLNIKKFSSESLLRKHKDLEIVYFFVSVFVPWTLIFFGVDPKNINTVLFNEVKSKADKYDTTMKF